MDKCLMPKENNISIKVRWCVYNKKTNLTNTRWYKLVHMENKMRDINWKNGLFLKEREVINISWRINFLIHLLVLKKSLIKFTIDDTLNILPNISIIIPYNLHNLAKFASSVVKTPKVNLRDSCRKFVTV